MIYRKHTRLGRSEFIRLNDDGSITIAMKESTAFNYRYYIGKSHDNTDWDNIYNNYSHSNAREFNDAYNLVKDNI